MSDLDAMHYGRTDKNHHGRADDASRDTDEQEPVGVGDEDMWEKLS